MGASDHFRRSVHACSRRFYAHPRIGIGSKKTGPREYREGNFPLSPFRYVMFPKHLISRARATRFNAEYDIPTTRSFVFTGASGINRRIPPRCNDSVSIFSSRGGGEEDVPFSYEDLSLSLELDGIAVSADVHAGRGPVGDWQA